MRRGPAAPTRRASTTRAGARQPTQGLSAGARAVALLTLAVATVSVGIKV